MPSKKKKGESNPQIEEDLTALQQSAEDQGLVLPNQSHCTWLLNIIHLHARKIAKEEIGEWESQTNDRINKLIQEVRDSKDHIENMKQQNLKQQRRVEHLEHQNALMKSELKKLHLKLDELEQDRYQSSVQIVGLPDNDNVDDTKQLIKLTKDKLGIKIKASDIQGISRLGKKKVGKTGNLNVSFKDKSTKESIYQQRKKLITEKSPGRNIYINDHLTKHRQSDNSW